jgi:asparagine synthase (glutamine-hydrolysing)
MGVKPLYYSFTTKHFILPPALFTAGVPLKMAQDGLEYIFLTDLLLEKTLYKTKVLPGHVMTIHEDGKPLKKWWDLKRNSKPT